MVDLHEICSLPTDLQVWCWGAVVAAVSSGGAMCSVKCFCWMMIFYLTSAKVGCCSYHTVEIEREEDKYEEESEEHVEDIEQLSCEIS